MSVPANQAQAAPTEQAPAQTQTQEAQTTTQAHPAAQTQAQAPTETTAPAQPNQEQKSEAQTQDAKKSTLLVDGLPESGQTEEASSQPEQKETVVPEKYDLKLPEGSSLKPSRIDEIAALAKESGLSNDAAQALLEYESEAHAAWLENQKAELGVKSQEWYRASEGDPEIGGAHFKESVRLANSVIAKFGSAPLKQALNESGLGNHPELLRFCAKIGKMMAPDQLVVAGIQSQPERSITDIFYPEMKKETK